MKKYLGILMALLFAINLTAQRKIVTDKLQVTKLKNAQVVGTDAKGNFVKKTSSVDLTPIQDELSNKLDKGGYVGTAQDLANQINEIGTNTGGVKTVNGIQPDVNGNIDIDGYVPIGTPYNGTWNINVRQKGFDFTFPVIDESNKEGVKLYVNQNDLEQNIRIRFNGTIIDSGLDGRDRETHWLYFDIPVDAVNTSSDNIVRIEHFGNVDDWGEIFDVVLKVKNKVVKSVNGVMPDSNGNIVVDTGGDTSNLVPYTGATQDVFLGENKIIFGKSSLSASSLLLYFKNKNTSNKVSFNKEVSLSNITDNIQGDIDGKHFIFNLMYPIPTGLESPVTTKVLRFPFKSGTIATLEDIVKPKIVRKTYSELNITTSESEPITATKIIITDIQMLNNIEYITIQHKSGGLFTLTSYIGSEDNFRAYESLGSNIFRSTSSKTVVIESLDGSEFTITFRGDEV